MWARGYVTMLSFSFIFESLLCVLDRKAAESGVIPLIEPVAMYSTTYSVLENLMRDAFNLAFDEARISANCGARAAALATHMLLREAFPDPEQWHATESLYMDIAWPGLKLHDVYGAPQIEAAYNGRWALRALVPVAPLERVVELLHAAFEAMRVVETDPNKLRSRVHLRALSLAQRREAWLLCRMGRTVRAA